MMKRGMRINRYLALCGLGSRRKCEQYILERYVSVNDAIVTDFNSLIHDGDRVKLKGKLIRPQAYVYLLLNKPKDVITSLSDEKSRKHVGMLIPRQYAVKPVGRLDRNTTGVLLLTNDGELHYRLTHPKFQVPKIYRVTLNNRLTADTIRNIQQGVRLEEGKIARAKVIKVSNSKNQAELTLELREGINREIRRLFQVLGFKVTRLERIRFAGISAEGLKSGQWRFLTAEEVNLLKAHSQLV
jgi:23S rRNA pseudouridine2605 synthase